MEDDYKITTGDFKCNICDKLKLCLQCNKCFVTTCVKCINVLKCNNCNNLFTRYELELIGYKKYVTDTAYINYNIRKYYSLYNIDLSKYNKQINKKIDELFIEIRIGTKNLIKLIYDKLCITKDKKLAKCLDMIQCIQIYNNNHISSVKYIKIYKDYTEDELINNELNIINKLICTYEIYQSCIHAEKGIIYREYDLEMLDNNIKHYLSTVKYPYLLKNIDNIIGASRISRHNCITIKHEGCGSVCRFYLKYYEDIPNKIICNKCGYYNFKFEDCTQIYCNTCKNIYDMISGKTESLFINPVIIYNLSNIIDHNDPIFIEDIILNYKYSLFIESLPPHVFEEKGKKIGKKQSAPVRTNKIKPSLINHDSNFYKVFKDIL